MSVGSHTIPRFYLEQFANPARGKGKPGRVWVYEKGKQAQLRATKAQGYENGYFGFVRSDGSLDESLEKHLAKLENECSDILACAKSKVCDLQSLANRNTLAFYAALLFHRATSQRRFTSGNRLKIQEPFSKLASHEDYIQDVAEHYTESTGERVTPEQIRQIFQKHVGQLSQKDSIRNSFIEELLFHAEITKSEFVEKPWQVWEAPSGAEFVTSDNPVVTFVRLTEELWHPGHGFRKPDVVVAFPLAPTACLTMGIGGQEFRNVDQTTVMRLNEQVIRASDRFVYAKVCVEKIAQMVEEFGRTSVPGENAFLGPFRDEKEIEEDMRRKLGIRRRAAR